MTAGRLFYIWLLSIAGNVLYQALDAGQYGVAIERSFFQGGALFTVWLFQKLDPILNPQEPK